MKRIDLHVHSRYSDGTLTPRQLVERAQKARLDVMFLTDHDTVSGFPEALEAAAGGGLALFCGVEINTSCSDQVHILGYGMDWESPEFARRLEEFRGRRALRIRRIVENLERHGLDISFPDVAAASQETLGRPHVADALRRKGIVKSRQEAFNRFLIRGKPGYVEPMGPSPEEAIALIRSSGGFAALAHPETVKDLSALAGWTAAGLEGLETFYSTHSASQLVQFRELAARHGLIETGGSDCHGPGTGRDGDLGVPVPDDVYERLSRRLGI